MTVDISDTLDPKSEQLDAIELVSGPRIFTIEGVTRGNAEQPVNLALKDFPRVWRPGKSMRRVLVACWGPDASQYVGRKVELFCDPDVKFGGIATGGTRISRLSHLDKSKSIPLLVARGKSAMFTVSPLPDAPTPGPDLINDAQMKKLHIVLKETGYTDRESALEKLSEITGREVASSKDLTRTEASTVIDHLTALAGME